MTRRCTAVLALLVCIAPAGAAQIRPDKLPPGWTLVRHDVIPKDQAAAIEQRLGGRIVALTNTVLAHDGGRVQVNVLRAASNSDAKKIEAALLKMHGGLRDFAFRQGRDVVEMVTDEARLARRARYALGLQPKTVRYEVTFLAAPLEKSEDMAWNRLYCAMIEWRKAPGERTEKAVRELAAKFEFARRLPLRGQGQGPHPSHYAFEPEPVGAPEPGPGDTQVHAFADLPTEAGVPRVRVTATVTSEAYATIPSETKNAADCLLATPHWPVEDPAIKTLAAKVAGSAKTAEAKRDAILAYLMPGRNLRFGGPITGSRCGVRKVLDQGFGHCWDFADVAVTLCRASGVPARMVAGWLEGVGGHVWAEVRLPGRGWVMIDPTAGDGCTTAYVPLVTSVDGRMPFVYASMPTITRQGD